MQVIAELGGEGFLMEVPLFQKKTQNKQQNKTNIPTTKGGT